MKKLLAFLLVLVMILSISLVACDKKAAVSDDDDDDDAWGNGSGVTDNNNNNNNNNGDGGNGGDYEPPVTLTWNNLDESSQFDVYVTYPVFLRNSPSANDKTTIKLELNDSVRVIATSNREWYKVNFDGNPYYIYSYLTTRDVRSLNFIDLPEPISSSVIDTLEGASESMHYLRTTPCFDENDVYNVNYINKLNAPISVNKTETSEGKNPLQVIALSENNVWAKVLYKGSTYYIKKSQLQVYKTEVPEGGLPVA